MPDAITITTLKNSTYVLVFLATTHYLGFSPESVSIFTTLMVIDVITGIIRACSQEGCRGIKSSIGVRGILAKLLTLTALFTIGLAGKGAGFDMYGTEQGIVNVLILAETYSILGNIYSSITNTKKNEFDAVAFILKQVRITLAKFIK